LIVSILMLFDFKNGRANFEEKILWIYTTTLMQISFHF
jgi:hypothetical protein